MPPRTHRASAQPHDNHDLPIFADRKTLAEIISHRLFPVAPRTLREWPLVAIRPNKRVVYRVEDALEYARERMRTTSYKQGWS